MFAIFTRLNRDDGLPRTEALQAETFLRRAWPPGALAGRIRTLIAVPLILGLLTLFVLMAVNSSGAQGCRPGPLISRTTSCTSAQEPASHL